MKKLKKAKMRLNIIIFICCILLFICFIWMNAVNKVQKQDNDISSLNLKLGANTISIEVIDNLILYSPLENGVHKNISFTDATTSNTVNCGFIVSEQEMAVYKSLSDQQEVGYQMYLSKEDLGNSQFYYLAATMNGNMMIVLSSPSIEAIENVFSGIIITLNDEIYQFATPTTQLIENISKVTTNTESNNSLFDNPSSVNTDDIENLYESNTFETEVKVNGIGDNHMGYYLNTDTNIIPEYTEEYDSADCVYFSHLFTDYSCTSCQYVYYINTDLTYMYKLEGIYSNDFYNLCINEDISTKFTNISDFNIVNVTETNLVATCTINEKQVYFVTSKDTTVDNAFATYFILVPTSYNDDYVSMLSNYNYRMSDWTGYIY